MARAWLLQGFFFQLQYPIGLELDLEGNPIGVVLQDMIGQFMFAGSIWEDAMIPGEMLGAMQDKIGDSRLSEIEFTEDHLKFVKQYDHRLDPITYEFHRSGSIWVGKYDGPATGTGGARVVLTPVDATFFTPDENMHFANPAIPDSVAEA